MPLAQKHISQRCDERLAKLMDHIFYILSYRRADDPTRPNLFNDQEETGTLPK